MSSAKPPQGKEPATLQTTRQMLDELDALMDRMLALPVNDLDDPAPPSRELVRMPTVSATLTVLESPVEQEEAPAQEERQPLRESFPTYTVESASASRDAIPPLPLLEPPPFQPPSRKAPPSDPDPIPEEVIPPSLTKLPVPLDRPDPVVKPLRMRRRSRISLCLVPLLWFNQGFDKGTILLGPTGRWLRGPRGRHFLGLSGLALLGVAGLWLVKDWLGWTW